MFIVDLFRTKSIRQQIESSEEFKEAEEFGQQHKPKDGIDYGWVEQHAAEEFRLCESRIDTIEAKADSLIKYLGAGSGVVALLLAKAPAWQVIPTLVLLLVALFVAIRALQPGEHPFLPKTKTAFEYAESYTAKEATACFATKIGAASAGMLVSARYKSKCVRWAFWFFLAALTWLVVYTAVTAIASHHPCAWVGSEFSRTIR